MLLVGPEAKKLRQSETVAADFLQHYTYAPLLEGS